MDETIEQSIEAITKSFNPEKLALGFKNRKANSEIPVLTKEQRAKKLKDLRKNNLYVAPAQEKLDIDSVLSRIDKTYKKRNLQQKVSYEDAKLVLFRIMQKRIEQKFEIYKRCEKQARIIKIVLQYFINDTNCPIPLHKGLVFMGNQGTSKSFLMSCFNKLCKELKLDKNFVENDAQAISDKAQMNGIGSLSDYYTKNRLFDDIGRDKPNSKHYGNEVEAFNRILFQRHKQFEKNGLLTFVTMNINFQEFTELYGSKISDRMLQMSNFVDFNKSDMGSFR